MTSRRVAFHHFGCKVNFAEASTLSRQFAEKGYTLTGFHDRADIYVISSCVVTAAAEKKCRAAIRQAHALNPDARIAVIGCFPELKSGEIASMEGVDVVLGHQGKFGLLEALETPVTKSEGARTRNVISRSRISERSEAAATKQDDGQGANMEGLSRIPDRESRIGPQPEVGFIPAYSYGDRTRSFLKIQDGCDYHCAYCTIPQARGKSRSDTIAHILEEASEITRSGVKEIVLTGVNIGDFGKQNGETLYQLLTVLEKEISIPRIRISSIEPDLLHDGIIGLIAASEKFLPHFHIPLQSGSDRILQAMKRRYSRALYADRVEKIRSLMPYACIAGDVIVGFPGETEEDLRETESFLASLPVSYLHVFSYSPREKTLASGMDALVPKSEKHRRSNLLHRLSDQKKRAFYLASQGREATVLFESDQKDGMMHGFTENYIKVKTPYDTALVNALRTVRLDVLEEDHCYLVAGELMR